MVSMIAIGFAPASVSAAGCSPGDTAACTAASCANAGGNWNGAANTCIFANTNVCSKNNPGGCTTQSSCVGSGNVWNPALDGGTCVSAENQNNSGNFATPARDCNDKPTFFGLVPWYEYLSMAPDGVGGCRVTNFDNDHVLGKKSPFLLIALAILDDLIRLAALVALGFVVYGGILYVTSQGSPDSTKHALQTIINALIGLVLALLAAGLVGFIGKQLGG